MKLKVLLTALLVAGFAASLALGASGRRTEDGTTTGSTTTTTTTTRERPKCQAVALSGAATSGSVAFQVAKASRNGAKLVNTPVTLAIPAGARVLAIACTDANGVLTLRSLNVGKMRGPRLENGEGKGRGKRK